MDYCNLHVDEALANSSGPRTKDADVGASLYGFCRMPGNVRN